MSLIEEAEDALRAAKELTMYENILLKYDVVRFVTIDGHEDAVLGIEETSNRLIYSVGRILWTLQDRDGMTDLQAMDFFLFNIQGAKWGKKSPIYCYDNF